METLKIPKCPGLVDMESWITMQTNHAGIIRWGRFRAHNPTLRQQTNLHHIPSVTRLFVIYGLLLMKYRFFDLGVLLAAIITHEDGEALLGRDISYIDKKGKDDFDEYKAFYKSIEHHPKDIQKKLLRSFLLQFTTSHENLDAWGALPAQVMYELQQNYRYEGYIFNALERMDYLYYTINSYNECGDIVLLVNLLRNQVPAIEKYIGIIDGFEKEVWTPELSAWAKEVVEICKDMPRRESTQDFEEAYKWAYQKTGILFNEKHKE